MERPKGRGPAADARDTRLPKVGACSLPASLGPCGLWPPAGSHRDPSGTWQGRAPRGRSRLLSRFIDGETVTQGKVACSRPQSDWVRTRALLILEPRFLEMPGLLVSGASLGPHAHSGAPGPCPLPGNPTALPRPLQILPQSI